MSLPDERVGRELPQLLAGAAAGGVGLRPWSRPWRTTRCSGRRLLGRRRAVVGDRHEARPAGRVGRREVRRVDLVGAEPAGRADVAAVEAVVDVVGVAQAVQHLVEDRLVVAADVAGVDAGQRSRAAGLGGVVGREASASRCGWRRRWRPGAGGVGAAGRVGRVELDADGRRAAGRDGQRRGLSRREPVAAGVGAGDREVAHDEGVVAVVREGERPGACCPR